MNFMKKTNLIPILLGIVIVLSGIAYFSKSNSETKIEHNVNPDLTIDKNIPDDKTLTKDELQYLKRGHEFIRNKNLDKALKEFEVAAKKYPDSPIIHFWIGKTYQYKKEPEKAIAKFKKVLELEPKNYRSLAMIGKILSFNKNKTDNALKYLNQAVSINPEFADAHFDIGRIYARRGDMNRAMAEFGLVFRTEPKYAIYHYEMGIIFEHINATDRARKEYERALQLNPNFTKAKNALKKLN